MQNNWNRMLTTPSRQSLSVWSISRRSPLARRWRWKWNWRLRTSNLTFHLSRAWEILAWEAGIGNRYHYRQFLSCLSVPWVLEVFALAPQADRSSAEYPSHETYPKPETAHEKSRVSFRLIKVKKTKTSCEPQGNSLKRLWKLLSKVFKYFMMPIAKFIRKCSNVALVDPSGQRKKKPASKCFCLYRILFVRTEIYHLSLSEFIVCYYQIQKIRKVASAIS